MLGGVWVAIFKGVLLSKGVIIQCLRYISHRCIKHPNTRGNFVVVSSCKVIKLLVACNSYPRLEILSVPSCIKNTDDQTTPHVRIAGNFQRVIFAVFTD